MARTKPAILKISNLRIQREDTVISTTSGGGSARPALDYSWGQRLRQDLPAQRLDRLSDAHRRRITVLGRRYGESDWRELRKQVASLVLPSATMADTEPAWKQSSAASMR